jgi:repressor of nif and glnA expression
MKFNNIERNILYLLSNEYLKSEISGPFNTKLIFDKFSDIPDKNMKYALKSINRRGFVDLTSNFRTISLTQKGLSKIKVINLPGNGKFPFPKKLE